MNWPASSWCEEEAKLRLEAGARRETPPRRAERMLDLTIADAILSQIDWAFSSALYKTQAGRLFTGYRFSARVNISSNFHFDSSKFLKFLENLAHA